MLSPIKLLLGAIAIVGALGIPTPLSPSNGFLPAAVAQGRTDHQAQTTATIAAANTAMILPASLTGTASALSPAPASDADGSRHVSRAVADDGVSEPIGLMLLVDLAIMAFIVKRRQGWSPLNGFPHGHSLPLQEQASRGKSSAKLVQTDRVEAHRPVALHR